MKIDRMMSIVLVLLDKKRISARELADMFEVSLRTIYRDIDAIDLAGVPICSTSGVGGGFEIMPNYKLDKQVFSTSDLTAILMGLSSLSNMIKKKELLNALTKIKSFVPIDKAEDIELKLNQIYIDSSEWIRNTHTQQYLGTIMTALKVNKQVTFNYIAHHGCYSKRTVEPYQLVFKSSHWYLYGYCIDRNDFRLFRLSRMFNLELSQDIFIPRNFEKPILNFESELAMIQKDIKIRIHNSIIDRVLDYCSYDHFYPDGNDYYIVNFPFVENDYYYDILLSFGNQCECLEPTHIRKKMKDRILEMAKIYQKKT